MHPAKDGFAALPFFDDFDLSTVEILLISQYVEQLLSFSCVFFDPYVHHHRKFLFMYFAGQEKFGHQFMFSYLVKEILMAGGSFFLRLPCLEHVYQYCNNEIICRTCVMLSVSLLYLCDPVGV